ncbi:MAG: DegT/DnrJ/EryC1/StrS family aminotransferase [Bacteroidales bacterium]|nr:MAG: DegT/DnrJ/EryC1/StrS family aminotransferase [Bacteroidales bacterium]
MRKIRMVDLNTQYLNIKNEIDTAIQDVIDSAYFVKSPVIKEFEEELARYLNASNVIACGNGTDALQISLMALDLKPGDEVITPVFTFISTVEVISLLGYKPVAADVDPDTFNINPDTLESIITDNTKAIIPVHLFGQCADMQKIMDIANKYNISIIEDAAQAMGSEFYKNNKPLKAGTIGHIGCTSFFPSKNLACFGDGGAVITGNNELGERIRTIANHGMKVRYHYDMVGVNSRLDAIQAAILRVKLKHLDKYNSARQKAADLYDNAFRNIPGIIIPFRAAYSSHVFHQYTIRLKNNSRDALKDYLQSKNIPSMIYYPVPLHLQKAFAFLGYKKGDFPFAEQLSKTVLSLPMHTEMDEEQIEYIASSVIEFVNK